MSSQAVATLTSPKKKEHVMPSGKTQFSSCTFKILSFSESDGLLTAKLWYDIIEKRAVSLPRKEQTMNHNTKLLLIGLSPLAAGTFMSFFP